jgi:hypothetical protein
VQLPCQDHPILENVARVQWYGGRLLHKSGTKDASCTAPKQESERPNPMSDSQNGAGKDVMVFKMIRCYGFAAIMTSPEQCMLSR